jgi:hypothetical protein
MDSSASPWLKQGCSTLSRKAPAWLTPPYLQVRGLAVPVNLYDTVCAAFERG